MKKIETNSYEETFSLGRTLGENAFISEVISLNGDLGTGKTVFTQGFAAGLGSEGPVSSPTFTIVQSYEDGRIPLHHFDVYRIEDPQEMEEIGFDEYLFGDGVCLIEWGDMVEELLPPETIRITIEKDPARGFDYRQITIEGEKSILEKGVRP